MSFVTRIFTSFVQNGFKNFTVSGASITSRNFHALVKSLPKSIAEIPTLSQNPTANNVLSPLSALTGLQRLLVPVSSSINQVSGFKVKGRLRRRCKDCYFVVRQQRLYVICPTHPRHKQMAMKQRDYKSWILTHATQSKIRPY